MVSVTQDGDYKIVSGTSSEILLEIKNDEVSKDDILGFQHATDTDVAVIYET